MPHSEDCLTWIDEIPGIRQLHVTGGYPGLTYLICDTKNEMLGEADGYKRLMGIVNGEPVVSPIFTLQNSLAGTETHFIVMVKGKRINSVSPQASAQPCYVDVSLEEFMEFVPPAETPVEPQFTPPEPDLEPDPVTSSNIDAALVAPQSAAR